MDNNYNVDQIRKIVLDYFNERADLSWADENEILTCQYLDIGIVDSLGIIEMVLFFEKEFSLNFTPVQMQSELFRTPGGLIVLLTNMIKKKKK
jgi:acyl carrier protein